MLERQHSSTPTAGIDLLCDQHLDLIEGKRCALLSHAAATTRSGATSAQLLAATIGNKLTCLLSPEHGYIGSADAGEACPSLIDPFLGIPIQSLYGENRKPTCEMLAGTDILIVDLQDLGLRCYTYVSTLALALEAAAEYGIPVIVTDRPIPFGSATAGPILNPRTRSFVGQIDAPFIYAMTPAETARWLQATAMNHLQLSTLTCDLKGRSLRDAFFNRWPAPPPSPALAAHESILCYPALVLLEAFSHISHGRGTPLPFQTFAADWIQGADTCDALNAAQLPGVRFFPHPVASTTAETPTCGVRLHIAEADSYQPITTAIHILHTIQSLHPDQLWTEPYARPDFFDKLAGTPDLREALQSGCLPDEIVASWQQDLNRFECQRAGALLYTRGES